MSSGTARPDLSRMLPLRRLRQFLRAALDTAPPAVPVETVVARALERARREGYLAEASEVREELNAHAAAQEVSVTRETYSLACTAPGCRWALLLVPSLHEAREQAHRHAETGHAVEIVRTVEETLEMIAARCTR